jgi:cell wall-associated NlpC family hydrolase
MSNTHAPSVTTASVACAPRTGRLSRLTPSALRLLAVGIAMMGITAVAMPAAAQQSEGGWASEVEAPPADQAPATGQVIVNFAMQFVGYPYIWAGNTPAGFDCSGFTQYVIANTVGIDIGHGVPGQTAYGAWVDWGTWQPGDLVFFANTYDAGISHVGIYIGDGQFVHAENESTGVTISSLYSDYYSGHYYGAYRIG